MNKHTQGPWSVGGSTEYINQLRIEPTIGIVYGAGDEIKANACLIAAAPELLEALEMVIPMLHTGDELPLSYYKDKSGALGIALRAIAKAKGE